MSGIWGVSNKVDLIQINRWKVGLGLLALFLLVCVPVHSKDKNYGRNFYLTVHASYPVDIGSVEVAKELATIYCPDFLVYPVDKNLVADINTIEIFEQLQEGSEFQTTFQINKQKITCENFYLEEKIDFSSVRKENTEMISNPDMSVVDKDSLALFLSKVQITNEDIIIEKIKFQDDKKVKNLSDEVIDIPNQTKAKNIEQKAYGLKFNLYSGDY